MTKGKVAVISGSKSDNHIVDTVITILKEFDVNYENKVLSAHRNAAGLRKYVDEANVDIFIAIAGMAAHLPGAIAALTIKPVIGVPVSGKLGGLDALLSIVQMPSGVPVASVAIDNGKNAALLAIEILALKEPHLLQNLTDFRKKIS